MHCITRSIRGKADTSSAVWFYTGIAVYVGVHTILQTVMEDGVACQSMRKSRICNSISGVAATKDSNYLKHKENGSFKAEVFATIGTIKS
jgi:hypothetical protein